MSIEVVPPEMLKLGVESLGIAAIAIGYFTHRQREWIRGIWGNKCAGSRIGMKHKCSGDIQIHHITPQGWAYEHLGMTEDEVDTPYNAIPLCADAHVGKRGTPDCIHPDQIGLDKLYHLDPTVYKQLQENRLNCAKNGEKYWNDRWDNNMVNLTRMVVDKWFSKHPQDEFPNHNHNGHK